MDREKAADLLDNLIGMVEDNHGADYDTALKMGIEALSTSGDGPEPVDDTISRQAAIDAFKKELTVGESKGNYVTLCSAVSYEGAKQILESLPSAQPEKVCIANITLSEEQIREAVEKAKEELKNSPILIEPEPQWIPCSERLPKLSEHKNDMVLVCYENGSVRFNTCWHGEWTQGNPIAWMPLPEPWRGEEHDTTI